MRELGGARHEDLLHDEMVQAVKRFLDVPGVRVGLRRILADDLERGELPPRHGVQHLREIQPVLGWIVVPPQRADPIAGRAVLLDVLEPGQLVRIAPMSPPPCTLFWPRSGLQPLPHLPIGPSAARD